MTTKTPLVSATASASRGADAPVLEARGLCKSFRRKRGAPEVDVLRDVSLSVGDGEFVAVVGPSGSGKSTLLYCLSSLEKPSSGSVRIAGEEVSGMSNAQRAQLRVERIGFVFQQFNLIPSLDARENVALPARLRGARDADQRADAALNAVGMTIRARHRPGTLSGGEQQRVAIARVLAAEPDIVFADEPTGALDEASGAAVLDLLGRLATDGRAVVMVTHDLEAASRADRVLVIRDGRLHADLASPTSAQIWNAMTAKGEGR
ncbi:MULTISPECIES: ABC transporter ATP-binding protein [Bacteria]|uniref:ABC transporter ATP-binding protein n=1 Tax=Bacteria TaxID=2 RepID=UPI003C7C504E